MSQISLKFGGPDPREEPHDTETEDEWIDEVCGGSDDNYNDEDERYYDDISGVELPKELVMTARQ